MGDWLSGIGDWFSSTFRGGGGDNAPAPVNYGVGPDASLGNEPGMAMGTPNQAVQTGFQWWNPTTWGGGGTTVPSDPSATGSGGGGSDWFSQLTQHPLDTLGGIAKAAVPLAQLGATGMGIAGGISAQNQAAQQAKLQRQAQRQLTTAAAPAVAAGGTLTDAGSRALMGGALPPEMEAQVQQWKEKQIAQINDQLSRMGIGDSTMRAQYLAWVDEQEKIMRGQLAGQLYTGGLQGIEAGTAPESAVLRSAQAQSNADTAALGNLSQNVFKVLGGTS